MEKVKGRAYPAGIFKNVNFEGFKKKKDVKMWSTASSLNRNLIAGCCEYGYEISDSVYREEFCDKLRDYWLLSRDSALSTWCVVRQF